MIYKYKPENVPEVDEIECSIEQLKKVQNGKFPLIYNRKDNNNVSEMNLDVYLDGYIDDDNKENVNIAVVLSEKWIKLLRQFLRKNSSITLWRIHLLQMPAISTITSMLKR